MRFAKVYLEITNVCNRSCSFCPKTERKPEFMPADRFETFARKLRPYTDYLYFHLMGEPLLHPRLDTLLRLAGTLGFRVILTTNGTLLPETAPVLLSAPALHKVNVSIHSFEANETGSFVAYLEGCIRFAAEAAARGKLINLRLWNLDGPDTEGKRERNPEILSKLEAAFPRPWEPCRDGYRLADRIYLHGAAAFRWPDLGAETVNERHGCYGLKDQLGVLCDGTVVPCCLDREGDVALGDLNTEELADILEKPRTCAILEGFSRGRAVEPLCKRCGYANRFQR